METFWENLVDLSKLLIKVLLILWVIDVVSVVFELEFRVPYLSAVTDWFFAKAAALA
jgi:hypothetical protein